MAIAITLTNPAAKLSVKAPVSRRISGLGDADLQT
jgi:hypothetical protein